MNPEDLLLGQDLEDEEVEKEKPQSKGQLDGEILKEMLMTGENTDGMFSPDEEELLDPDDPDDKLHEDPDEMADVTTGALGKKFGEYQKKLLQDMKKNPEAYTIMTPKGEMNVVEAMKQGYDPVTKEFTGEVLGEGLDDELAGLPEDQQEALRGLLNPSAAHMAPDQGAAYGLDPNSPMIDPGMGQGIPEEEPMMDPSMGGMGGMM